MVETLIALRSNWSSQRASTNSSGKRNLRLGLVQVMLRGLNTTQDLIRAGSVNFFTFFVEKASQCPLLIRKNNTLEVYGTSHNKVYINIQRSKRQ